MNAPSQVFQAPETPNEFPNGNAKIDIVYQLANPANPLQQLAVMSMDTYMKTGTLIESQRQMMRKQDDRIKELLALNQILAAEAADARSRLENLRAVRKAEKRPEVEALFDLPKE
jgi:uncharacterized lipoprotein YddW (UPF0748 family)